MTPGENVTSAANEASERIKAGVDDAKRTSRSATHRKRRVRQRIGGSIPLAHPLPLGRVDVTFEWTGETVLRVEATASTYAATGVEMEAMIAASIAALTIYDMTKSVDKGITIDPEAANGMDVAMMETLRLRPQCPPEVGTELVGEVQRLATKRNVKTLTFLVSMSNTRAITQVKSWGFEEFRIMPEADKMLAFFRKSVD